MSCIASVSAPSTPTEQVKQIHNASTKKKAKHNNRVHFPDDELLVSCFLDPPDPWSKVYGNTLNTLISSYVAACDKQGIKPLSCVLDQLQEYESSSHRLQANPRAFDLSILGEKLSMKHCEALEEVLRRLQFQLVDLEGCYLEDEGAAAFFDMIEYYDSAVQLNISFTKHIDCRGWQACSRMLKKTTSLVHLNARSTGLNEQVLLIVGRALRLGSNLVTLHLENCGIFGRCLVILVAALKLNTTMRELFLAENKISAADGFQLGNLLRTNTHLELLDLSNNKLGDEGLTHVMDSLGQQSNTSGRGLYTLVLWNNEITAKGMPCVSRALTAARALRKLNLGSNSITGAGVLELKQSLICNRTIEILELENASITSTGVFAIAEYITQNQFIQKLDIRGNDIRLADLVAISQAVEKNPNVTSLLVDPTSMDLTEPLKDRQECLQEINKYCQRNKEAKSSLPPQDAQLSILFNGIFSHVLPSPVPSDNDKPTFPQAAPKSRFRVSIVVQDNIPPLKNPVQENGIIKKEQDVKPVSEDLSSFSKDTGYSTVRSVTEKTLKDVDDLKIESAPKENGTDHTLNNVIQENGIVQKDTEIDIKPVSESVRSFSLDSSYSVVVESKLELKSNVVGSIIDMPKVASVPKDNLYNSVGAMPKAFAALKDSLFYSVSEKPAPSDNITVGDAPKTTPKDIDGLAPKDDSNLYNSVGAVPEAFASLKDSLFYSVGEGSLSSKDNDDSVGKETKTGDGLVLDRVRWLEGLNNEQDVPYSVKSAISEPVLAGLGDDSEVFLPSKGEQRVIGEPCGGEPKVRRSSSPTMSSVCRKTHSIKCCKELEGLDLRSTVPLSPTRLHEGFDFPDSQVSDVPLNSQMNIKSSHAVYMVH